MTNDKHLQDVEEALEACAAPLETRIRSWFKWWCRAMTLAREVRRLRSELDRARKVVEAAVNLRPSEPSFDDARLSYVEVQIERDELNDFRSAVSEYAAPAATKEGE